MAIHWTIPLLLLLSQALVQARPPSLYWPGQQDSHALQTRAQLDESALNSLNENELETLLYLLDKVDRPRVVPNAEQVERFTYAHPYYDTRNKRTGHHANSKKAVDWSDYFGIDKREVKVSDPVEVKQPDPEVTTVSAKPLPDAKNDREREEILKEFYANMAMAGNVRRKRAVRSHATTNTMEKEMTKVGENLIWDALKLTGAHRDEKLSKEEFKQLKKELIRRIGAAYDLEKLRHVFEGNIFKFANKSKIGQ